MYINSLAAPLIIKLRELCDMFIHTQVQCVYTYTSHTQHSNACMYEKMRMSMRCSYLLQALSMQYMHIYTHTSSSL